MSNERASAVAATAGGDGNWLFKKLPPWIQDTLTTEQREAIHNAAADTSWRGHQVNIRLSLPFFGRRYYVTVVGGQEKRDTDRRNAERHRYPLRTAANIFFVIAVGTIFYVLALVGLAMHSTILEF